MLVTDQHLPLLPLRAESSKIGDGANDQPRRAERHREPSAIAMPSPKIAAIWIHDLLLPSPSHC